MTIANDAPARSPCPIAATLDLVGDRWTLLIVRDMLAGKARYGEFQAAREAIPSNILADRLKRLVETGLVEKRVYRSRPIRYNYILTPVGRALAPVLQDMCRWANSHIPGTWRPNERFMKPGFRGLQ